MAVNLRHYFFAIQAVIAEMTAAGGGSIVNVGSIAWMIPSTGLAAYVTAKAAIVGLTRTLAHELGPANIRVNCVLPGAIVTERQKRLWMTPEYSAAVRNAQSLKRDLGPADVARLVLFLAADDSSAMTGQNYIIDGGRYEQQASYSRRAARSEDRCGGDATCAIRANFAAAASLHSSRTRQTSHSKPIRLPIRIILTAGIQTCFSASAPRPSPHGKRSLAAFLKAKECPPKATLFA